jgi:hypothetical protein
MFLKLYPYFYSICSLVPLSGLGVYMIISHISRSVFHIIYIELLARTKESSKDSTADIEKGH